MNSLTSRMRKAGVALVGVLLVVVGIVASSPRATAQVSEQNCAPPPNGEWVIRELTVTCVNRSITVHNLTIFPESTVTFKGPFCELWIDAVQGPTTGDDWDYTWNDWSNGISVSGGTFPWTGSQLHILDGCKVRSLHPEIRPHFSVSSYSKLHIADSIVQGFRDISLVPSGSPWEDTELEAVLERSQFLDMDFGIFDATDGRQKVEIRDNFFRNIRFYVTNIEGKPVIENNVITNCAVGIGLYDGSPQPTVRYNTITNCQRGIALTGPTGEVVEQQGIHYNDIFANDNPHCGRNIHPDMVCPTFDAGFPGNGENNWWGRSPPDAGRLGGFDYAPYRTSPVAPERLPVVTASGIPASTLVGSSLSFSASATPSQNYGASIVGYSWDFGDGEKANGPSVTHAYSTPGTYTVLVTAKDALGLSNNHQRTLSVQQPNRPPVVEGLGIEPASPIQGQVLHASATATDPDNEAATLAYEWRENGVLQNDLTGSDVPGSRVQSGDAWAVSAKARDPHGAESTPANYAVTVGNRAPSISSLTLTPTAPKRGEALAATVAGSDPDGQAVSYAYAWTRDGELQTDLTGASVPGSRVIKGQEWRVEVTPSDGQSNGPSRAATVTVQNTAPTLSAATATPSSVATGETVALRAVAADADGDSLSATWTLSGGGTLSGLETSTSFPQAGTYTIPVSISDGQASSTPGSVTVTVTAPSGGTGGDSGDGTGSDSGGDTGGGDTGESTGGDSGGDTGEGTGGGPGDSNTGGGNTGGGTSDGTPGDDTGGTTGSDDADSSTSAGNTDGSGDSVNSGEAGGSDATDGTSTQEEGEGGDDAALLGDDFEQDSAFGVDGSGNLDRVAGRGFPWLWVGLAGVWVPVLGLVVFLLRGRQPTTRSVSSKRP